MLTYFGAEDPVTRFRELDTARYAELFRHLLERGIYVAPSQYECMFPSLAHGDEEIDATLEAFGELGR
jgi:glutamate-1-semialdehyde 2,1-aminomutase